MYVLKNKKAIAAACLAVLMFMIAAEAEAQTKETEGREAIIIADADILAKVMYTECRGVKSDTEKAAVAWCVLNRVDHPDYPNTIREVVTQSGQFAWNKNAPVTIELLTLAQDVLLRWELEKLGQGDVGRVLPKEYIYFAGDGEENRFRATFRGSTYYWDWAMESPYEE